MNQVLALKYRPRQFSDLIGQDTISATLSLALDNNRLSHAYLLSGLRGSGKTSTARIMAKALVCKNAPTSKPCDICDACIGANENRHLDIIEMDAASNRGIDDIKDLIEHTKYKPTSAKFKIFIIDEVHMLTSQAFNALLKTLEEPPQFVKFILATTDPLKLPATILSRTQHYRFKRISTNEVTKHLSNILKTEEILFELEALEILARAGQGSLRDTLTLLDQNIVFSKNNITIQSTTDMLGMIDPNFLQTFFDAILLDKDTLMFLEDFEQFDAGQVIDEMTIFIKQRMLEQDPKFDTFMYDRFFRIFGDAKQLLSLNSDSGFVLILMTMKLKEATNMQTIDEIIEDVQKIQTNDVIENTSIKEEPKTNKTSKVTIEPFQEVIKKIFDRDYKLGECFETSFSLGSYENNKLTINSQAKDECRTLLHKHIMLIKEIIRDVYGENTDIDYVKVSVPQSNSCVSSLCEPTNPTVAQQDISINDVLNSDMVNTAVEIFKATNSPEIKNKV